MIGSLSLNLMQKTFSNLASPSKTSTMPPKRCPIRSQKRARDTQATQEDSQTFEEELRSVILETPADSAAVTATDTLLPHDNDISSDEERYTDNYDGIQWEAYLSWLRPHCRSDCWGGVVAAPCW